MKKRDFDSIKPYCYFLVRKQDSKFYFGVRYRNVKQNRTPRQDFAKHYFTSGKLRKEFEEDKRAFKYRLVCTFDSVKEAQTHEVKINKRLIKRPNSANLAAFPFIDLSDKEVYANLLKSRRTDKYRKKMRDRMLGTKLSKETIEKMLKNRVYKPWTDEQKKTHSEKFKGRVLPREGIEKMRKKLIGRKLSISHVETLRKKWAIAKSLGTRKVSAETKRKISKGMIENHPLRGKFGKDSPNYGKKRKPGTGANISKAKMGHKVSAATRKKISDTLKKRHKLKN